DKLRFAVEQFHVTYKKFRYIKRIPYLATLHEKGEDDLLLAVMRSPNSPYYIRTEIALCLDNQIPTKELIALCELPDRDEMSWANLLGRLTTRRREEVIPYLKTVMTRGDTQEKCWCYGCCDWPDIVSYAEADQYSTDVFLRPNSVGTETLGSEAREYLARV